VDSAREARAQGAAVVRAAGGVVVRSAGDGDEVLVVHRPRYDDWTFPKGKAYPGETDEDCALREVEEETGLRCELDRELPTTEYLDAHGRPKRVRYWLMRPIGGRLVFLHEVDDARWTSPDAARALLTYGRDLPLLESLAVLPLDSGG
jgi:8-oxo-dGTP diphosphatase